MPNLSAQRPTNVGERHDHHATAGLVPGSAPAGRDRALLGRHEVDAARASPPRRVLAARGSTAEPSRKVWFARHKVLTSILAALLFFVFVGAAVGGEDEPDTASDEPTSTSRDTDQDSGSEDKSEPAETSPDDADTDSDDASGSASVAEPAAAPAEAEAEEAADLSRGPGRRRGHPGARQRGNGAAGRDRHPGTRRLRIRGREQQPGPPGRWASRCGSPSPTRTPTATVGCCAT